MAEIVFPTVPGPRTQTLVPNRRNAVSRSFYTGNQKVYEFPYFLWSMQLSYPRMTRAQAQAFWRFIMDCRGQVNHFRVPLTMAKQPLGGPVSIMTLTNAETARTKSFTITKTDGDALTAGDYVEIDSHLHMAMDDVPAAGISGTLRLEPGLRANYAAGTVVETSVPSAKFRLTSGGVGWDFDYVQTYGFEFDLIEFLE